MRNWKHGQHIVPGADAGLDHGIIGNGCLNVLGILVIICDEQGHAPSAGRISDRSMRNKISFFQQALQELPVLFHE